MKELDLLKKDWKNSELTFDQISEIEIYKMLHQKSSSIVRWIFVISIIELGLGFVLGLLLSFTKWDEESISKIKEWGIYNYYIASTLLMYGVVFFFIYKFYCIYQKISVVDTTKQLISTILKTRKVLKQYIAFNLTAFAILFIIIGSYSGYKGFIDAAIKKGDLHPEMPLTTAIISLLILILVTTIFTFAFWLIYKLIYGILLKHLNKNYEELRKLDF